MKLSAKTSYQQPKMNEKDCSLQNSYAIEETTMWRKNKLQKKHHLISNFCFCVLSQFEQITADSKVLDQQSCCIISAPIAKLEKSTRGNFFSQRNKTALVFNACCPFRLTKRKHVVRVIFIFIFFFLTVERSRVYGSGFVCRVSALRIKCTCSENLKEEEKNPLEHQFLVCFFFCFWFCFFCLFVVVVFFAQRPDLC